MKRTSPLIPLAGGWILCLSSALAHAETPADASAPPPIEDRDRDVYRAKLSKLTERGPYFDLFGTLMFGDGLRFNNPYRLSHELGETGESVSSTAPYFDLAVAATTGNPNGLQHGARIGWSVSTSGVPQQTLTPSYLALLRVAPAWLFYGWAGLPVVLEPDLNVGGELAAGATWFALSGIGVTGALVLDGFYGAGTTETRAVFYPVVSAQLGVLVAYEVFP